MGLTLLHTSHSAVAKAGEWVDFFAYVLNEGAVEFHDVRLVVMSLQNADLLQLEHVWLVRGEGLRNGILAPGAFAVWRARYQVSAGDVAAGGPVISAMAASATSADGVNLWRQSDVVIEVDASAAGA